MFSQCRDVRFPDSFFSYSHRYHASHLRKFFESELKPALCWNPFGYAAASSFGYYDFAVRYYNSEDIEARFGGKRPSFWTSNTFIELNTIQSHKRGSGFGTAVMWKMMAVSIEKGCPGQIYVGDPNVGAHPFFAKEGFIPVLPEHKYWGNTVADQLLNPNGRLPHYNYDVKLILSPEGIARWLECFNHPQKSFETFTDLSHLKNNMAPSWRYKEWILEKEYLEEQKKSEITTSEMTEPGLKNNPSEESSYRSARLGSR